MARRRRSPSGPRFAHNRTLVLPCFLLCFRSYSSTYPRCATNSISTSTPRGNAATCTVDRAGRASPMAAVHLVHARKVRHVLQKDRRLHDVLPCRAGRREHGLQVLHDAMGLRHDIPFDDLAGDRIDRNLPGGIEETAGDDGL